MKEVMLLNYTMWATGSAKQSVVVYSRAVDLNICTGIADKLYQSIATNLKVKNQVKIEG